jgi:hypothetical protein
MLETVLEDEPSWREILYVEPVEPRDRRREPGAGARPHRNAALRQGLTPRKSLPRPQGSYRQEG